MAIYLGKVSDYSSFQYRFLSEHNLKALKDRRIAHYRAMIEALEQDDKDFRRYLKYEAKLRRAILSKRYSNERLEHLMNKVHEMRWYIEEEFGRSDGECIAILPSPEGYAEKRWRNARDAALARARQAEHEARRRRMCAAVDRGEAEYDDFCRSCYHQCLDEREDDYHHVIHRTWICPDCGEKLWDDEIVLW